MCWYGCRERTLVMIRQAWHLWCTMLVLFHFRANQLHCTHQQNFALLLMLQRQRAVFVVRLLVQHTAQVYWYNAVSDQCNVDVAPCFIACYGWPAHNVRHRNALLNSAGEVSHCESVLQHVALQCTTQGNACNMHNVMVLSKTQDIHANQRLTIQSGSLTRYLLNLSDYISLANLTPTVLWDQSTALWDQPTVTGSFRPMKVLEYNSTIVMRCTALALAQAQWL